jgi:hypothetical protein
MTGRAPKPPSHPERPKPPDKEKKHLDELLDEALEETFPASDPAAILEPAPDSPPRERKPDK